MSTCLVTGAAGFIGYHCVKNLLGRYDRVVGIDNLNDYYSVQLKLDRLADIRQDAAREGFVFEQIDCADRQAIEDLFRSHDFDHVLHLAAQAGVRYSLENPAAYVDSNLVGFANILEGCRQRKVDHLVYASSSSVYGGNREIPFSTDQRTDAPINLYAATKKSNELMAHAYSHLYGIPMTGLRFFTVYGPWGRPDMAVYKFTERILAGRPIDVYNAGEMRRDFTYVDDVVAAISRILGRPVAQDDANQDDHSATAASHQVYNIGNHRPVHLTQLIAAIETACGRKAIRHEMPMQAGDMLETYAEIDPIASDYGFRPDTKIEDGIASFVHWYQEYFGVGVAAG